MAVPDTAYTQTRGDADGRPAQFKIDDTQLNIQYEHSSDYGPEATISTANIIAVTADRKGSPDAHSILYTISNAESDDESNKAPYVFKTVRTTNLPRRLIDDFKPVEESYWLRGHDSPTGQAAAHVIISTGSGTGLAQSVWERLVKPLLDYNGLVEREHYRVHFTASETSVSELAQSVILPTANKGEAQSILLLSGDGGVVDIVNVLLAREKVDPYVKPVISLLPLGTGNAMANSSGITGDQTMGLRSMFRGSRKEVPLFRATFSSGARLLVNEGQEERPLQGFVDGMPVAYGAVVFSWGIHATLVADSDTREYRKFGAERFKMAGKEALFPSDGSRPHAYKGKVMVQRPGSDDWEAISRDEHGYILATLVSNLEAGFTISPASKPLDGKLRLVQFGPLSGSEAMDIMTKAYQGGKHVDDDRVGYEEIERLRIDFGEFDGRWRRVCIDGKIIRIEKGGWVEVQGSVGGVVDLVVQEN